MPKKKVFTPAANVLREMHRVEFQPKGACNSANPLVHFPREQNASTRKVFSFLDWYGCGIDEITSAYQEQIERFLLVRPNDISTTTIIAYCASGAKFFLNFCAVKAKLEQRELILSNVNRTLIADYICHLDSKPMKLASRKAIYAAGKSVINGLMQSGCIVKFEFPKNPYPGSHQASRSSDPLNDEERKLVARALSTAVKPIFSKAAQPTGLLLAHCLLALSLRTGRNTTPLLELEIDCLSDHFLPHRKVLNLRKRRGNSSQLTPIRSADADEIRVGILPDSIRIIERVIELTATLRAEAPEHWRKRLWLYRSVSPTSTGNITVLNTSSLSFAKDELQQAMGNNIALSVRRFRTTFVNRVYEISGKSQAVAAKAAGHSMAVNGSNYLAPPIQAKVDFRLMGEIYSQKLFQGMPILENTPTGKCRDTGQGEYAPKNGSVCTSFINCMRCRSYVVTEDDLYRLFSFYWLVVAERNRIGKKRWNKSYRNVVQTIDRDIVEAGVKGKKLSKSAVEAARSRAKASPHPFWTDSDNLGVME